MALTEAESEEAVLEEHNYLGEKGMHVVGSSSSYKQHCVCVVREKAGVELRSRTLASFQNPIALHFLTSLSSYVVVVAVVQLLLLFPTKRTQEAAKKRFFFIFVSHMRAPRYSLSSLHNIQIHIQRGWLAPS